MNPAETPETTLTSRPFGTIRGGAPVFLYTLTRGDLQVSVTGFGARLTSVRVPGRDGSVAEVALGHDSLAPYLADEKTFMGAIVGRFGNRIAAGKFTLDGETCQVPLNDGPNALHGGTVGFDRKLWAAEASDDAVTFTLVSPDGDMGFPGKLMVSVRYSLPAGGGLLLEYTATTDRATVVNVTNHAYFNLGGEAGSGILDHELTIPTGLYTPVNENLIPVGEVFSVAGTPFDFRTPTRIGERIDDDDVQLKRAGGYDHNWAFGEKGSAKITAKLKHTASGRVLTVETTEPGMQFYAGNFLDGTVPTRDGRGTIAYRSGLCLETQGFPDSPNQPAFPSVVLRAGETLRSTTTFLFSVED